MKIHKIEVKAEIIIKAVITFGTTNKMDVPITTHNIENNKLMTGTLLFDKRPKLLGASFSTAKPYNIRLVAKTPLFAEDIAEVATTKLTILAAAGKPIKVNISTNGLLSGEICAQDVTAIIQTSAPT